MTPPQVHWMYSNIRILVTDGHGTCSIWLYDSGFTSSKGAPHMFAVSTPTPHARYFFFRNWECARP